AAREGVHAGGERHPGGPFDQVHLVRVAQQHHRRGQPGCHRSRTRLGEPSGGFDQPLLDAHVDAHEPFPAMVSTVRATRSNESPARSSSSTTSLSLSTVSASYSPEKSRTSSIR